LDLQRNGGNEPQVDRIVQHPGKPAQRSADGSALPGVKSVAKDLSKILLVTAGLESSLDSIPYGTKTHQKGRGNRIHLAAETLLKFSQSLLKVASHDSFLSSPSILSTLEKISLSSPLTFATQETLPSREP
jgi:hypothetical protein